MKKLKENIDLIFIIILICAIFLMGKKCGENKEKTILKPESISIVKYKDTIFPKDTIYLHDIKILKGKVDTFLKPVYIDSNKCNTVYKYEDSIITKDYNIYSKLYLQGIFRDLQLGVKLKVPLIIKDSIVIKKDSFIYKPYKYEVFLSLMASPKMLAVGLDLRKDNSIYTIGYDPFNKMPILGYKYRIFKSKE